MSDVGNTLTITASLIGADQVVLGTAKMSAATVKGTKSLSRVGQRLAQVLVSKIVPSSSA